MSELELDLKLLIDLGTHYGQHSKRKHDLQTQVYQDVIPGTQMTLVGGAGILDRGDLFGPTHGWMMEMQRLTLTGFSAGTFTCTIDGGEPVNFPNMSATGGTQYFGKGDLVIPSGSRLIFSATGITGNFIVYGASTMFPTDFYPYYVS